jgi:hypothetical protein
MSHGLLGPFPICRRIGLAINFPPIPLRCHRRWYSKLYIADWFFNPFTMLPWPLTVWCVASWCGGFELSNRNQNAKGKQKFQSCKIIQFELNSILPSPYVCSACSVYTVRSLPKAVRASKVWKRLNQVKLIRSAGETLEEYSAPLLFSHEFSRGK